MVKRIHWQIGLLVIGVLFVSVGWIIAQTDTPPFQPTCDTAEVIFNQYDMQRKLDEFDELYLQDAQAALTLLYDAGKMYQQMALECGYLPADFALLAIGTDLTRIMNALDNLQGDSMRGQLLYNDLELSGTGSQLACAGCHESAGAIAPPTEGTWTRWDEVHRLEARFAEYDFRQYIAESIIHPNNYFAEGFDTPGIMPNNFGERLTYQDLADIIAYMESQDQLPD